MAAGAVFSLPKTAGGVKRGRSSFVWRPRPQAGVQINGSRASGKTSAVNTRVFSPDGKKMEVPVVGSTIAAYRCPADPSRKPVSHGSTPGSRSNYVGCFSPDGTMVELDHVRDGTAHTIAAAETIAVDDEYRGNLAVWRAIASIDGGEPTADF